MRFFPRSRRGSEAPAAPVDPETILATADGLACTGDYRGAISLILDSRLRSAAIDHRLVDLRHEAFRNLTWPDKSESPPTVEDLFPLTDGIPEIERADLDAKHLRSAIVHHGSLIVRGLFDLDHVERVKADIDNVFTEAGTAQPDPQSDETWFRPFPAFPEKGARRWVMNGGGILAFDAPTAMYDVIEMFNSVQLKRIVDDYFGEEGVLLGKKWTLRRVSHELVVARDWHQDGAFMGEHIRSLNLWTALSHCGDSAPGLDLVARRLDHIVETGTEGAGLGWTVSPERAEEVAQGKIVRPIFEAGDGLFFDHMNLHRTAVDEGMLEDRYAIESWFLAPSTYKLMKIEKENASIHQPGSDQIPLLF